MTLSLLSIRPVAVTVIIGVFAALLPAQATESVTLRYKFTVGQTLRYKITIDPLFENPAGSLQLTDENALEGKPIVRALTAEVKAVKTDGTATVQVSVAPEEQDAQVAKPETSTLEISPIGQVLSETPPATGLTQTFCRLPFAPVSLGAQWSGNASRGQTGVLPEASLTLTQFCDDSGLAVITRTTPPTVTEVATHTHDGTLVDTMRRVRSDRIVFDIASGNVLKQASTLSVSLALKMTNRGWRVRSDFGHVIPITRLTLYATVYRMDGPAAP